MESNITTEEEVLLWIKKATVIPTGYTGNVQCSTECNEEFFVDRQVRYVPSQEHGDAAQLPFPCCTAQIDNCFSMNVGDLDCSTVGEMNVNHTDDKPMA